MSELERLCVHESVENVVPKEAFVEAFADLDVLAELVGDDGRYNETDAVATYRPRPEFLDAAWVHCVRAGYDEFDTDSYRASGVSLTNSTGIHATTAGELAVSYMLSFARMLHIYRDHQNATHWYTPDYDRPFTVEGKRLCVVGLGTIGRGIAERADALGMEVIGVRRSDEPIRGVSRVYAPEELHEAIADARFVALAVPHTPATEGMMSTAEFERMRDDAFLVNVARGPVVDEDALVDALDVGAIAGAGLDVFETEPLPEDSPLWDFDEVIISPHKASATNRYHLDIAELVVENVRRFRTGEELKNQVA
ncbi:D-2-hydroxyacid dehydrogenase [Haladaptatus halobius]|uniref:D-2-hydroxyacid dehydrogenase n=1 Tax=Haladaptatus halobius TaxID=2884875 RepID=UPI001D0B40E1|nr:D-2-hydroxyacid dehydrogenase [Haladaptatus halobius]